MSMNSMALVLRMLCIVLCLDPLAMATDRDREEIQRCTLLRTHFPAYSGSILSFTALYDMKMIPIE